MRYFFIVVLAMISFAVRADFSYQGDSIGVERVGEKVYILHQVEAKETVYSISRKYSVSAKDILSINPSSDKGLSIGQIIKVPHQGSAIAPPQGVLEHEVQPKETLYSIARKYDVEPGDIIDRNKLSSNILDIGQILWIYPQLKEEVRNKVVFDDLSVLHVVNNGETLYSISRSKEVPLDSLRLWNELVTNDISIGDTLIIGKKSPPPPAINDYSFKVVKQSDTSSRFEPPPPLTDEVIESGLAEAIKGSAKNQKYLGLHRSVPVGTVMRVRNEMNGQEVFVRIIGKLPNTGANKNVIIKISKSAYDSLGAIDARFRVTISYLP